jgi:hypothetical protein
MKRGNSAAILTMLLLASMGCRGPLQESGGEPSTMQATIEEAVRDAGRWADIRGVESVGQGEKDGSPCIQVLVSTQEAARQIPTSFQGYPVVVERTGPIGAQ